MASTVRNAGLPILASDDADATQRRLMIGNDWFYNRKDKTKKTLK